MSYSYLFPRASERRVLLIVGVCYISWHLHIFSSSSSHLHRSSSHLHTLTSAQLHTSSLHIFSSSSSHLHRSSSHLHIFHICTAHLHICTHLHTSSHIFTPLHTSSHIFTHLLSLSLLHIFTSSHLLSLPLSPPSLSLIPLSLSLAPSPSPSPSPSLSLSFSCPLAVSRSLSFFFFSLLRPRAVPTRRHEMATLSHEMRFDRQKLRVFLRVWLVLVKGLRLQVLVCRSVCVWKRLHLKCLCVKGSVCKSVWV